MSGTLYSKLATAQQTGVEGESSEAVGPIAPSDSGSDSLKSLLPNAAHSELESRVPVAGSLFDLQIRCQSKTQLIKSIAEVSRQQLETSFLWYIESDAQNGPRALALTSADQTSLWQSIDEDVIRLLGSLDKAGMVVRTTISSNSSSILIGTQFVDEQGNPESIIAITPRNADSIEATEEFITLFAMTVQTWGRRNSLQGSAAAAGSYQKLIQLSNILTGVDTVDEACVCSVNFLRELTKARQVALTVRRPGSDRHQVQAISDIETFDKTSELCASMVAISRFAEVQQKSLHWHSEMDTLDAETLVENPEDDANDFQQWQRRFCNLTSSDFASAIPLELRDGTTICILVAQADEKSAKESESILDACSKTIANQLGLLQRSNRGALRISLEKTRDTLRKKTARIMMAIALAAVIVLLIPFPYVVKCDCQLEPVQRRFVAAPFDSVVDRSLVQNGDVVKANQPLAELDGRQLRIELAGLQASLESEKKKHDAALAQRDVASSQIALLEVRRLEADIELTKDKLKNLIIRSPIDGIVVSGDLEDAEGAPVDVGQTLFEIAPLDRMLVEVEVEEAEVCYAKPGQKVDVLFDAFPFDKFEGKVLRIHPRTEIREDRSIFVAEVELENSNGQLRPGMKGRCRVQSDWHPLGWNLFHRSFENVRGWLVW